MTKSSDAKPVEVALTRQIEAHGEKIDKLTIREPTVAEIRKCGYPIDGNARLDAEAGAKLIAACAEIPPSSVDAMSPKDFTAAMGALAGFFGGDE